MHMGNGVPGLFYLQRMYWAVVGTAIGIATLVNVLDKIVETQRSVNRLFPTTLDWEGPC
jgi:hypothetical protein